MKSRPVLITFSILAGLHVLCSAAALGDVIGVTAFALLNIGVASVEVGMTFYVQNGVVPQQDVGAYTNSTGQMVAGPAAGATNGTPVVVEPGTYLAADVERQDLDTRLEPGRG